MSRALEQVSDAGPVADYMTQDVISSFAGEIRVKGLSGASLANFSEKLGHYSRALNEVFPERAAKVNKFIRTVNRAAGDKAALELALQAATDAADVTRSAIKESELGLFLRDALGKEFDTTNGPYNAFRSIFQDAKDGVGKLTDLKPV